MRRLMISLVALSIAAIPVTLEAQLPRAARGAPGLAGAPKNPAARVLEHREALGLSLAQVRQLQQIQERIEQQNRPLLDQLPASAPMRQPLQERRAQATPEQREEMRKQMQERHARATPEQREEMRKQMQERRTTMLERVRDPALRQQIEARRPVLEQLQSNERQAREEVQAILTAQQRDQLRDMQRQRMDDVRGRVQGRERPAGAAMRMQRRGPGR